MTIPTDPETRLRRAAAAEALTEALTKAGYPISGTTLNKMAALGTGPEYRLFGRIPLYRWADLLQWAEARMTSPTKKGAVR